MEPAKNVTDDDDDGSKAKLVAKLWIAGLAATYGGCDKGELGLQQQQKKLPFVHPFPGHSELSSSLTSSADAAKHQLADIDEAVRLIRERTLKRSDEDSAASAAAAASLEELSTVMLGLCRLVADNAKQLVVSADKAEDELMKTEEDGNGEEEEDDEELLAQKKRKLGDDEGNEEEEDDEEFGVAAPVKRKKLKIDKLTQQPSKCCTDEEGEEVEDGTEEEEEQSLLEKKVPDFGLPTKQSMEQSGCCCLMRDDLPRSAGRSLPAKLEYLYERKCCGSSSGSKKTATKTAKTARRRRSMTCDSGGAGSGSGNDGGGKRARVEESSPPPSAEAAAAGDGDVDKVHDKVLVHEEAEDKQKKEQQQLQQQQQSPQSSNTSPAYQACVKDPLNEQSLISSLPFDYDDDGEEEEEDEEEEEMTLNLLLQLYGGQEENKKKKKKKVAGEHQQQPMHYLPVRWRHMMTGTSTGDGQGRPPLPPPLPPSSSRAVVDSDQHHQQQPMDERASLFSNSRRSIRTRCTVRSASIGRGQQQQLQHQFGNSSAAAARRATASIKSIIYARDRRDPSQLPWWWQPVTPVIPPPALSQPLLRSLPAAAIRASHAVNQQTGSIRSKICSSNRSTRSSLTSSEVLQHRLLSILSTRSCRGTIRVYELEQLVRAATATFTDADPTGPLSKQVVVAHFVALLRMNSTVQLRQKAAGGRRRPGLRLADFSSPSSAAVHKIYVSLVVNEKREEKEKEAVVMKPPSDFLLPPATESAPFTA